MIPKDTHNNENSIEHNVKSDEIEERGTNLASHGIQKVEEAGLIKSHEEP